MEKCNGSGEVILTGRAACKWYTVHGKGHSLSGQGMLQHHSGTIVLPQHYTTKPPEKQDEEDRKSTRLNSSHQIISYAVFCLKKKKDSQQRIQRDMLQPVHIPDGRSTRDTD